jgi:peptidoglycan-N-acetylglucosamine deacetylase
MNLFTSQSVAAVTATGIVGLSSAYLSPWLWRRRRMARIHESLASRRVLALTYDDGPNDVTTAKLLDILSKYGARATFFMLGSNAQKYPAVVDRVVREGHEVGCHTDRHLNAWKVLPWRAIKDIELGYEHLAPWIQRDAAFRPPYGKLTLSTQRAVLRYGASIWWWTIDSGDSREVLSTPKKVAESLRYEGGGIVLMHDGTLTERSPERNNYTLDVTAALLDVAKSEGIKTVTLGELCE